MSIEKTKDFYREDIADALRACRRAHYQPEFAPELIDRRINAEKEDSLWQDWWTTLSLKATGRTSAGTPIIVYAHEPHYFSQPKNIAWEIEAGLINGAGTLPVGELSRLESGKAGGRIFVLDHASTIKWPSGYYGLEKPTEKHLKQYTGKVDGKEMLAINHPLLAPLMGNENKVAPYLTKLAQVYGKDKVYINNFDDFNERDAGRLVWLGSDFYHGFIDGNLYDDARFFGVRLVGVVGESAPAGHEAQKIRPNLDDFVSEIVEKSCPRFVSTYSQTAFEREIRQVGRKYFKP